MRTVNVLLQCEEEKVSLLYQTALFESRRDIFSVHRAEKQHQLVDEDTAAKSFLSTLFLTFTCDDPPTQKGPAGAQKCSSRNVHTETTEISAETL